MMNKDQYVQALVRRLQEQDSKEKKEIYNSKVYKSYEKDKKKLKIAIDRISNIMDSLLGKNRYEARDRKINLFRNEWDEISLIVNKDKRILAREKLLKKYNLFR